MQKLPLVIIILMLSTSKSYASIITSSASDFFLNLANQTNSFQSINNEWQVGMYTNGGFELFDYSPSTVLGRPSIVGWSKGGFHTAFLNTGADESFPGNVFKSGSLNLHPGQRGAEIVLRYLVQQDSIYDFVSDFFALDTIKCANCVSDGVNVSVTVNGSQFTNSLDIIGTATQNMHSVSGNEIPLKRGDSIDFIVLPKSTYYDDATMVTTSVSRDKITSVKEPQMFGIVLVGLIILMIRHRAQLNPCLCMRLLATTLVHQQTSHSLIQR